MRSGLPEELISSALSLTTPLDACRAAAVSRDFRAAAESDAAWSRFVPHPHPHDLPSLADGELSGPAPASTKGRFLRLSDGPPLRDGGLMVRTTPETLCDPSISSLVDLLTHRIH
jgi:hypothetical protein